MEGGEKRPSLTLKGGSFGCPHCGAVRDYDVNASLNIRDYTARFARIYTD